MDAVRDVASHEANRAADVEERWVTPAIEVAAAATDRGLLFRNVTANAVRVLSSAGVTILLPFALALVMSKREYSGWAFAFSLSVYVVYFDVGIPQSVQVAVAAARTAADAARMQQVVKAGVGITGVVGAALLVIAVAGGVLINQLAPSMPLRLQSDVGITLVILVAGQLASLMGVTVSAFFMGLQQNVVPARILTPAQSAALLLALSASLAGASMPLIALAFSTPFVAGSLLLYRRMIASPEWSGSRVRRRPRQRLRDMRSLASYSGPLMLWSLFSLAAFGFGSFVVGHFAYQDVTNYALAFIPATGLTGLIGSLATPLLPEFARVHTSDARALGGKIVAATRVHSALLFTAVGWLLALIPVYGIAIGAKVNAGATQFWLTLLLVLAGTTVHLAGTPGSLGFVASNTHRRLIMPPFLQASVSVGLSLALVGPLGAVGVGIGVAIGALVGILMMAFRSTRLADISGLAPMSVFLWTLGGPLVGFIFPLAATAVIYANHRQGQLVGFVVASGAATIGMAWQLMVVMPEAERHRLAESLMNRAARWRR